MCERLRVMVDLLEARHDGEAIALCAHADVIQIFQLWMGGCDVRTFSSYRFKNGEVRCCDPSGEGLCDPAVFFLPLPDLRHLFFFSFFRLLPLLIRAFDSRVIGGKEDIISIRCVIIIIIFRVSPSSPLDAARRPLPAPMVSQAGVAA